MDRFERLWAPWRLSYVADPARKTTASGEDCFICNGLAADNDRENLLVLRTAHSAVYVNRFPYNNGHLLVAPLAHKSKIQDLTADEMLDAQQTIARMLALIEKLMRPEGFNVGLNLGRCAGAGLPGHLHWHLVPRWIGDTNFMPVLTDTRVIVQSLDALYDMLVEALRAEPMA